MSRTRRRRYDDNRRRYRDGRGDAKGVGYEYGSRRPGNKGYMQSPSKGVKRMTHKHERIDSAEDTRAQFEDFLEGDDDE